MTKKCIKCQKEINDDVQFCPYCGTSQKETSEMKNYCVHCGKEIDKGIKFCPHCGKSQQNAESPDIKSIAKDSFEKVSDTINTKMGESGKTDIHIKDLFVEVFKKHTKRDEDLIFACGSEETTPKESEIVSSWPKPWLYSRIFIGLFLVSAVLYFMASNLNNSNAIPGLIVISSAVFPVSILIFFWEMNVPRNISFYQVLKMFLIGGVFSLLCTLILYRIIPVGSMGYAAAMTVGFIEETGKVIVVAYFVQKLDSKYILNGLLIGAAIGAGFECFETAGYVFRSVSNLSYFVSFIAYRGSTALAGHAIWAAISGAALVAIKRDQKLTSNMFTNPRFLFFFVIVIVAHGLWDSPLTILGSYNYKFAILCIAVWIIILPQISAGLKQVERISKKAKSLE